MPRKYGWAKKKQPPEGYDYIRPTMTALENELRTVVADDASTKRKNEATWPVHQINWQRSRYIYDMYYTYKKISKELFEWCISQKIADGPLMKQWRKQGYERLCSMLAINPKNFNYGTVSICRVPRSQLREGQIVESVLTGCRGCASGKDGYHNIFDNRYGQRLASIQIQREERAERLRKERLAAQEEKRRAAALASDSESDSESESSDDESDSDSDSDDDGDRGKDRKNKGKGRGKRKRDGDEEHNSVWARNAVEAAAGEAGGSNKRAKTEVVEPGEFIASGAFEGARAGFVFKSGSKGVGYYTDTSA